MAHCLHAPNDGGSSCSLRTGLNISFLDLGKKAADQRSVGFSHVAQSHQADTRKPNF